MQADSCYGAALPGETPGRQGRSFSKMAAIAASFAAVMCIAALATRQHSFGVDSRTQRAMLVQKVVEKHGLDKLSAAIHVQLKHLSAKEKDRISKLSAVETEEMKGEILMKAAQDTLRKAVAAKKEAYSGLKQQAIQKILTSERFFRAQMLQEVNSTGNSTNGTNATVVEEENPGAFDLSAWLDQQPDPSTWSDPSTPFDLDSYMECQPQFDLAKWLRDTSESLKPGCPTLRLADCADTDIEDDDGNVEATHKCCRVEIKHEGEWGAVCDDTSEEDLAALAKVACRAAGCKGAIQAVYSFGGPASLPIWLDNVECVGSETDLSKCVNAGWGKHNCGSSEDIGVCCTDGCEGWGGME